MLVDCRARVAVIDSGWDENVRDKRVLRGVGFEIRPEGTVAAVEGADQDLLGHGTSCVHILLRVAPRSEVVPLRVFQSRLETSPAILLAALEWCVAAEIRLVNLSLGTLRSDAIAPLRAICQRAERAGVIVVAAGGSGTKASYPAIFPEVIGVGYYAGPGPRTYAYRADRGLECCLAKLAIQTRTLGGKEVELRGTSMLTPIITGVIACLLAEQPNLGIAQIREYLARLEDPFAALAT